MKIGVNDGHTLRGAGTGAVGRIKEGEHTRKVGDAVRRLFRERGNTVYNCTVDYASTTNESLSLVVQQANREELDWFISIHFNAGKGQGVEVYTYEGRQYQDAIDVCNNIANVLGIPNRGVKAGTGLYVIRKTKAKSMLIEVCFVDSDDADKYLSVGHEAIAKAIVDALDQHVYYKKVHVGEYLNVKPFNAGFGIYKDDSNWELWNRIAYLGCPISAKILDNPSKNVYKVKDCRYGFEGYCYIEENNNTTFTSYQAYVEKEESKEVLFKIIADGVQITDLCRAKWIPDMIEEQLKKGVKDIKILECN